MAIEIHPRFKLNGFSFDKEGIKEVGYSLVKEGDSYEQNIGDFLLDWCNDFTSIAISTSGSTGIPKRISLKKRHMINSAVATGEFFGLEPGDSILLCLPAEFVAGKMMLVRAMVLGLELDYVEPSSRPLDFVSKTYDFCAMVPLQVKNSINNLNRIKTLIVGGAPMSNKLKEQVQDNKTEIYETYGMTETITHIALKKINNIESGNQPVPGVRTRKNSFRTLPGVKVSKDDRDCLVIDAPNIADTQIVSNDIVNLLSENEFEWLGRYDNIINSGGVKLFPEQIEAKLEPLIENRFFVAGLPDEDLGQRVVLLIEGKFDEKELLNKMRAQKGIQKFEIPKKILAVSRFSETASGKIDRINTLKSLLG